MIIDGAARVAARYSGKARGCLRLSQSLISGIWGDYNMPKFCGKDKNGIGIYQDSFYPFPNQRKWKTVRASNQREADKLFRTWKAEYQQTAPDNSQDASFANIKDRFEIKCKADQDCDKTIKNYRSVYRNFFERFLPKEYPAISDM